MKTIGIVNQKGGVGKTATAVNIAYNLAKWGQKVCLIDSDPQANTTTHVGVELDEGMPTLYNWLNFSDSGSNPTTFKDVSVEKHSMHIIPSSRFLSRAKSDEPGKEKVLKNTIRSSSELEDFDYVIIDAPPQPGFLNNNVICASDEIIIPTICRAFGVEAVSKVLDTVDVLKRNIKGVDTKVRGVLPTMYNASIGEHVKCLEFLKIGFQDLVMDPIRQSTEVSECTGYGLPVEIYKPSCNGAKDMKKIAEKILEFSFENW